MNKAGFRNVRSLKAVGCALIACFAVAAPAVAGDMDVMADFQGIKYTEEGRPVGMLPLTVSAMWKPTL